MNEFDLKLAESSLWPLKADGIEILQVNLGFRCNQACRHCHVGAGPNRTEAMSRDDIEAVLRIVRNSPLRALDLTGGAPELHPDFEYLVTKARDAGCHVMNRCNLTVLLEPGKEHLATFLSDHQVEIIASLPYFLEDNVDRQRGQGVFSRSIEGLRRLNSVGYGVEGSGLGVALVYNPGGAFLPGSQLELEMQFRSELGRRHGVAFSRLFTMTNMPIGRFSDYLQRSGNEEQYWERLQNGFNHNSVAGLMCRHLISTSWDGRLFDCDFNQMLGLQLSPGLPTHLRDFDFQKLAERTIATAEHCFGCTAGYGSSCGGALANLV